MVTFFYRRLYLAARPLFCAELIRRGDTDKRSALPITFRTALRVEPIIWHMNSQFGKPSHRRWTHISPNQLHKHDIDHILTNEKFVTDFSVAPSNTTGSNQCLLSGNLHFNTKIARNSKVGGAKPLLPSSFVA
uniref:Uncharacterized protein n=2 Tax=Caenorhabditis japonica TaxID=281687 RepID=A0A8R1HMK2_CAEJA